ERVSRYVIRDMLGQGGMSIVYVAYDPELDRKIALKMLRRALSEQLGPDARDRVLREGQAMARLSHPNVLHVHDVGTYDDSVFLAMEYVDGVTLRDWLKQGPHRTREIVQRFLDAGEGLVAAHAVGLIHRDFKPDNVLLGRDGRVRVADFGLVRAFDTSEGLPSSVQTGGAASQLGAVVGTPAYMAPEQRQGGKVDTRTDQFSFCVALYEAFTGERPGARNKHTKLPRWLAPITDRGLSEKQDDRYPSMRELLEDLRKHSGTARRRMPWVMMSTGALLVAATVVGVLATRRPARIGCEQPELRLGGIWDSAHADSVKGAFEKTGKVYASDTFSRVSQTLESFSREFNKSWRAACEADAAASNDTAREFATLSALCLDAQREELRTLVTDFAVADSKLLDRAPDAALGLPKPGACVDARTLEGSRQLLKQSIQNPAAQELRLRLARLRAQTREGKFEEAKPNAEKLVADARALKDDPLLAEVLMAQGLLLSDAWEAEKSEKALREGFELAFSVGHDLVAAQAAVELVHVIGYAQERVAEGRQWATVAHAALGRLGNAPELEARLWNNEGHLHFFVGEYDESVVAYEKSLEIRRRVLGEDSPEYAAPLFNLGRNLDYMGNPKAGLEKINEAREILRKALGPNHPKVGIASNGVAWSSLQLGQLETAEKEARLSVDIAAQSGGEDSPIAEDSRVTLAAVLLARGKYEEGVQEALRADKTLTAAGERESLAAVAAEAECQGLYELKRVADAQKACDRAVELIEKAEDVDPSEHSLAYESRGALYLNLGRPADAEKEFNHSLELLTKGKFPTLIPRTGLARCAMERGDAAKAKALLGDPKSGLGGADVAWRSDAMLQAGRIARALGDESGGNKLLDEAEEMLGPDPSGFAPLRARIASARAVKVGQAGSP
ncbi:MAG: protein kinase domain-containing protein, partial [Myxococcaceae bacterium]